MLRSTRAALAVGLGFVGVVALVVPSVAQTGDNKVKQTAGAAGAAPLPLPPTSIGTIDVEGVFREYYKVAVAGETLNAEVMKRYKELSDLATEGKNQQQLLEKFTPGSPDAKACEAKMVSLKAQIEAGKTNAQREFEQKETETMAGIYNEVTDMARAVAEKKGMTFIVKYNSSKVQGSEPNSAMSAMSKTIVYADPKVDITKDTIYYLNARYEKMGGVMPKPQAANGAAGSRPGTPAPAAAGAAPAPTRR